MDSKFLHDLCIFGGSLAILLGGWYGHQKSLRHCPNCKAESYRVLYAGFPMRLCSNDACCEGAPTMYGFWSLLLGTVIPFNGVVLIYNTSYPKALWHFLFDRHDDEA